MISELSVVAVNNQQQDMKALNTLSKPHICFNISGSIVQPTRLSSDSDSVTSEEETINEETESINEEEESINEEEETINEETESIDNLRFHSSVLKIYKGFSSEVDYTEYDLLPEYTDYFAYRVKILEQNCMITTHPSSNNAYLAIPNLFYYDFKLNLWKHALIENKEITNQLNKLINTPKAGFLQTNLFIGTKSDYKQLYNLAVFPDSNVIIGGGRTYHFVQSIKKAFSHNPFLSPNPDLIEDKYEVSHDMFAFQFNNQPIDDTIYFPIQLVNKNVAVYSFTEFPLECKIVVKNNKFHPYNGFNNGFSIENYTHITASEDSHYNFSNTFPILANPFTDNNVVLSLLTELRNFNCKAGTLVGSSIYSFAKSSQFDLTRSFHTLSLNQDETIKGLLKELINAQFQELLKERDDI